MICLEFKVNLSNQTSEAKTTMIRMTAQRDKKKKWLASLFWRKYDTAFKLNRDIIILTLYRYLHLIIIIFSGMLKIKRSLFKN